MGNFTQEDIDSIVTAFDIQGQRQNAQIKAVFEEILLDMGGGTKTTYVAILNQTGTNAPVATVHENTLGGTLVWSRSGVGDYRATLTGAFSDATAVVISGLTRYSSLLDPLLPVFVADVNDDDSIYLQTYSVSEQDSGGNLLKTAQDAWLFNVPIIIDIYG